VGLATTTITSMPIGDVIASLEALRPKVLTCQLCLLRAEATQVLFGEGVPTARIVFCGEAPGADEDAQGQPFVGKSGQLLTRMMTAMGFDRTRNAYILNVVKCRPPNNRPPTPDEIATCFPHTIAQVGLLAPAILVTLGSPATHAFLPNSGPIGKTHGHWQTWDDIAVMPTYHPSAMLRKPAWAHEAWADMIQVVERYRELVDPLHLAPNVPLPHPSVRAAKG